MQVKLAFTKEPAVFMASGLKVGRRYLPCGTEIKFLIQKMVERAVGAEVGMNPSHRCTLTCGKIANMVIGGVGVGLRHRVPDDMVGLVEDFEDVLNEAMGAENGIVQVKAVGLMFTPCSKKTEILESAIYLKNLQ